jgi:hypothetical protein
LSGRGSGLLSLLRMLVKVYVLVETIVLELSQLDRHARHLNELQRGFTVFERLNQVQDLYFKKIKIKLIVIIISIQY